MYNKEKDIMKKEEVHRGSVHTIWKTLIWRQEP